MADLQPKPYVVINGAEMPTRFSDGDAVVLDNLTIRWGRTRMFDEVSPATLSLTILDKTGAWLKAQQLLGLEIMTGVRFTDNQGTAQQFINFRGRITEAEVVARDAELTTGADNGFMVYIRAADKLTEVGNTFISNMTWPSEGYEYRKPRFLNAASSIVAGIGGSYVNGQLQFSQKKIDQASVLDLIAEHLAAGVEWINYDPNTNTIETQGRVAYEGGNATWTGLKLAETAAGTGTYGLQTDVSNFYAPYTRMDYNIDAGSLIPNSGIRRSIEWGITEIRYEYSVNAAGDKGTYVLGTGLSQSIYGRRAFTISTENIGPYVADFAGNYQKAAITAQTWQPPEVTWDTRIPGHGFKSFVQVRSMISGRAWSDPLFLSRSRYNAFPNRVPVHHIIGGTMTYAADKSGAMGWVVEPSFGSVEFPVTTFTPLRWNTINPSTSTIVGWDDLDDNVTWNDIHLTGQGV